MAAVTRRGLCPQRGQTQIPSPACGRPFCLDHAPLECRPDCSLEISRVECRGAFWTTFLGCAASFLGTVLLAPPTWYGLLGAEALVSVPLLVVGKDQGRKLALRRNKVRGGIIDGVKIQIARAAAAEK